MRWQEYNPEFTKRVIVVVDLPKDGAIKEIIIRHPLSYDFATSQFKEIPLPDEKVRELVESNIIKERVKAQRFRIWQR